MSLGIPVMIKAGVNTARIQSRINNLGTEISSNASRIALCLRFHFHMLVYILNSDRGFINKDTDR